MSEKGADWHEQSQDLQEIEKLFYKRQTDKMRNLEHLKAMLTMVQAGIYLIEQEKPEVIDWEMFKTVAVNHIQGISLG